MVQREPLQAEGLSADGQAPPPKWQPALRETRPVPPAQGPPSEPDEEGLSLLHEKVYRKEYRNRSCHRVRHQLPKGLPVKELFFKKIRALSSTLNSYGMT